MSEFQPHSIAQKVDKLVHLGLGDAFERQLASYDGVIHQPTLYYELRAKGIGEIPLAVIRHPLLSKKEGQLVEDRSGASPNIVFGLEQPSAVVIDFQNRKKKRQRIERRFVEVAQNGDLIFARSIEKRKPDAKVRAVPRREELVRLEGSEQTPENIDRALAQLFPDGGYRGPAMLE